MTVGEEASSYHSPLFGVIKSLNQLYDCALPTATAAHQGQWLTLLHLQIQPSEDGHIWSWGVIELNVFEVNLSVKLFLEFKERKREQMVSRALKAVLSVSVCVSDIPVLLLPLKGYLWQASGLSTSGGERPTLWPWHSLERKHWPHQ